MYLINFDNYYCMVDRIEKKLKKTFFKKHWKLNPEVNKREIN